MKFELKLLPSVLAPNLERNLKIHHSEERIHSFAVTNHFAEKKLVVLNKLLLALRLACLAIDHILGS